MANELKYSKLQQSSAKFAQMFAKFGVVTVMNAKVYDTNAVFAAYNVSSFYEMSHRGTDVGNAAGILDELQKLTPLCELKTLKVANLSQEGPTKSITGGRYADTLLKYGKTCRIEMQDALGNYKAIEAFCGGIGEYESAEGDISAMHIGSAFSSTKTIVGETFFLDENGEQVWVDIIIYQMVPDSLLNLTQDAEGDATVFDLNGDLKTTDIKVSSTVTGQSVTLGVFYSILPHAEASSAYFTTSVAEGTGLMTVTAVDTYKVKVDNGTAGATGTIAKDNAARVQVVKADGTTVVYDTVVQNY